MKALCLEVLIIPGGKQKEVQIKWKKFRREAMVIGFVLLLMLLTLWGWYLKSNQIEVFDAACTPAKQPLQTSLSTAIENAGPSDAFSRSLAEQLPGQTDSAAAANSDLPQKEGKSRTNIPAKININTAPEEELVWLNGIGEVKAREIVAYREQNGAFQSIEQIQEVKGIGEAIFQKIKDWITVGQ